jgi:hypothetical protein
MHYAPRVLLSLAMSACTSSADRGENLQKKQGRPDVASEPPRPLCARRVDLLDIRRAAHASLEARGYAKTPPHAHWAQRTLSPVFPETWPPQACSVELFAYYAHSRAHESEATPNPTIPPFRPYPRDAGSPPVAIVRIDLADGAINIVRLDVPPEHPRVGVRVWADDGLPDHDAAEEVRLLNCVAQGEEDCETESIYSTYRTWMSDERYPHLVSVWPRYADFVDAVLPPGAPGSFVFDELGERTWGDQWTRRRPGR